MTVPNTYDELADHYHLIYENWEASVQRQAGILSSLLKRECALDGTPSILDCACGIGTQALGLKKLGFRVTGCDLSSRAIERARSEASRRNLDIPFAVANMRDLSPIGNSLFDVVICMDNSLPHLESAEQLRQAVVQMRSKLRAGGFLMASIRDYDRLMQEKPALQPPNFYSEHGSRRIVFQVWDWLDDRRYVFHLYITRELDTGWETFHTSGCYRALRREELAAVLSQSGFKDVRWLMPAESGFYQPIVIATAT